MREPNRRNFVKWAAAPLLIPSSAWGANDRPAYGLIGAGNRGRWLNESFQKLGAQSVALCDVYDVNLKLAQAQSPPDAKTYTACEELLKQSGIDFVVIATADHHHRPIFIDALAGGLDIYLEKPISISLDESAAMVEAAKGTKRVIQVGMQRRSMNFIREARAFVQGGALGEISMVEAAWNWHFTLPLDNGPLPGTLDWDRFLGSAPKRPLEPRRFRWWRGFWDYSGGNITDQGTHLMDVVQWMTNSGPPTSVTCQGRAIKAEGVEVPNVFSAVFEYPGFIATWTLDYRSAHENDWWITFRGEKATMVMNRLGYRIFDDPGESPTPWSSAEAKLSKQVDDHDTPISHLQNFLECVKSRNPTNCPIDVGASAVLGPHLANIAYREGRRVRYAGGKVI